MIIQDLHNIYYPVATVLFDKIIQPFVGWGGCVLWSVVARYMPKVLLNHFMQFVYRGGSLLIKVH